MDYNYIQWDEVTDDDIKPGARLYRNLGAVTLVCRIGHHDDYAVYAGWANFSLDEIADFGNKVHSLIGAALFPDCSHLNYRL